MLPAKKSTRQCYAQRGYGGSVTPFFPTPAAGITNYYVCPMNCVNHTPGPREKNIEDYLTGLSNNASQDDDQTENLKWSLRQDLYEEILKDSALLDSFPVLVAFYDSISQNSEGKFAEVNDLISSLSDSSIVSDSLEQEIIIQEAENTNDLVSVLKVYENNRKVINSIVFETLARNNCNFTVVQKNAVESIAFQCPYIGGTAVFEARAIMQNWNDEEYFQDVLLCDVNSNFRNLSPLKVDGFNYMNIFPNPTSDVIYIKYFIADNIKAKLKIHDLTGRLVYSEYINNSTGQLQIDAAAFNPGSYYIEIVYQGNHHLRNKINIVR